MQISFLYCNLWHFYKADNQVEVIISILRRKVIVKLKERLCTLSWMSNLMKREDIQLFIAIPPLISN